MAVKLEGCGVVKTKPFTNSVTKQVKRVTCKVKSILEWIKQEGKITM